MNLRVCIDARMPEGQSGGVQQFVIGVASGLASLSDGNERYFFLCLPHTKDWLIPFIGKNSELLVTHEGIRLQSIFRRLKSLNRLAQEIATKSGPLAYRVPPSNGLIERLGIHVMHFTWQLGFITDVPSIYHPHDLQHIHLPQFFTPRERARRDRLHATLCEQARVVAVATDWTRADVVANLRLPPEKVRVIPLAPPLDTHRPTPETPEMIRRKHQLPHSFILYPAQTWPHKNHIGLLHALRTIRERFGVSVPLVCTGAMNDYFPEIRRCIAELNLTESCRFLGFIPVGELASLYGLATAVVIPTKFESGSFPLIEAFRAGAPVACSNVTSLPQLAGEAALLFDPDDIETMVDAIFRLWTDGSLRSELAERGRRRVDAYSWHKTALDFRSLYRQIGHAGGPAPDHCEHTRRSNGR